MFAIVNICLNNVFQVVMGINSNPCTRYCCAEMVHDLYSNQKCLIIQNCLLAHVVHCRRFFKNKSLYGMIRSRFWSMLSMRFYWQRAWRDHWIVWIWNWCCVSFWLWCFECTTDGFIEIMEGMLAKTSWAANIKIYATMSKLLILRKKLFGRSIPWRYSYTFTSLNDVPVTYLKWFNPLHLGHICEYLWVLMAGYPQLWW